MINIDLHSLISQLKPSKKSLAAGESLFQQGDLVHRFHCVERGHIRLVRNTEDGAQPILFEALSGKTFAEASLFSDKYQCTALAVVDTEVCYCKKNDILEALKHNPELMYKLLMSLSEQVRNLRTISEIKNIRKSKARILSYFHAFSDESGVIHLDPSIKDVAQKIGISHETFYRELRKLEEESIIQRADRKISIKK